MINFDVIILSETWLTEKDLILNDIYFGSYNVINVTRNVFRVNATRGSGGQLILFNTNVNVTKIKSICEHFLVLKVSGEETHSESATLISSYIPPKETTFVCNSCSNDYYDQLLVLTAKYRNQNLLIVGNLNSRTGALSDLYVKCEGTDCEIELLIPKDECDDVLLQQRVYSDKKVNEYGKYLIDLCS